jgi:hypothetical protein
MQFPKKTFIVPASLALLAGAPLVHGAVIYDSQGFEPAGDFSPTGRMGYDTDPATLYGQGDPYWTATPLPPSDGHTGAPADIVTTLGLPPNPNIGSQAVEFSRATGSIDTRWAPSTFINTPYQAVSDQTPIVDINWSMDVASGGSNDLFGIELNNGAGAGNRIAFVAVDQDGVVNEDVAGNGVPSATVVSTDEWNNYDLRANFTTQTYQVFVNGVAVEPSVAFEDSASAFTDASLVSYGDGSPASGTAYYDNYSISATPEPAAGVGSVVAGCGFLTLRRRRTSKSF